ncbi:MAG: caspase family protein, partial [bacterium]
MKRLVLSFSLFLFLAVLLAAPSVAQRNDRAVRVQGRQAAHNTVNEQRVALVIGNSAYTRISRLKNPVNGARAMTQVLKQSGFQVTTLIDANRRKMLRAITSFGKKLRNGGVGLFYYAGHGVQARGRNYLIPLGAEVEDVPDLEYEAVDAGRVLGKMESAKNRLNIVILDACRNNPYGGAFRSARNGLAQVNAPSGSLVAYASGPGKVAADGDGKNGLYTEQLIRHLRTPGLKLEEVFKRVRIDVQRLSGGKQVPWENTSVTGDFYFAGASVGSSARVTANVPKGPGRS